MADTIEQRYTDIEQWEALLEEVDLNLRRRTRLISDGVTKCVSPILQNRGTKSF